MSERLRLRELPHPAQSENLDHAVRVQSSLQGTRQSLICEGKGPAHRRHFVILAGSPLSSTQLIPANTGKDKNVTPITETMYNTSHLTKQSHSVCLCVVIVLNFPTDIFVFICDIISLIKQLSHVHIHSLIEQEQGGKDLLINILCLIVSERKCSCRIAI